MTRGTIGCHPASRYQVPRPGIMSAVNLKGLTKLETLWLEGTHVTDAGVAELQKALPDCKIKR